MAKISNKLVKDIKPRIPKVPQDPKEPIDITSSWRIFKIMGEFVSGFEFLKQYDLAVTFFGTARCTSNSKIYKETVKLAKGLSKMGFAIITGGGPGIMEAANKGAFLVKGNSIGLNIQLPFEQRINRYVKESRAFHYFFTRKVMLAYASELYIFSPGGYGTLDELFEILTLIQTKKICKIPVILVGKEYWTPLLDWVNDTLYKKNKAIDKADMELYHLVDDAEEAIELVKDLIKDGKIITTEHPVEYSEDQKIQKVKK